MRLRDRVEATPPVAGSPSLIGFQGVWANTDATSTWIKSIELNVADDHLRVRVRGAGQEPSDWGKVDAEAVYADGIYSVRGAAFRASFDRGSTTVLLQANLNLGLLVVAGFHLDAGGSNKSDFFLREFFYQAGMS